MVKTTMWRLGGPTCKIYKVSSINKLQNSINLLGLQICKNTKYTFCREFYSEQVYNFLMMTSLLWRHRFTEHSLHVYYFPHQ